MKKQGKALLMLALTILMLVSFTSCEAVLETLVEVFQTDVSGSVVNAMAADSEAEYWKGDGESTLEGATLSFYERQADGTYSDTAVTTADVTSFGNFYVSALAMGEYKIQGEKTGWIFVPRYVDIAGDNMTVPPVIAYPTQGNDVAVILLSWEDTDLDLDAITTFYNGSARDYVGYLRPSGSGITTSFSQDGFQDTTGNANLPISRPRDIQSTTAADIPRVETMVIRWSDSAPYLDAAGTTDGVADSQLRYYVNCYSSNLSLTGVDAGASPTPFSNAQVDVMYTDWEGTTGHWGGWVMPWNTDEQVLNVVNISVDSSNGFTFYSGNGALYDHATTNLYMRSADYDGGTVAVDSVK